MTTPSGSGRRERRKQQTRDRLLEAGVRLFVRQGYDATSVDEIAEAADVARQTFFNHFRAKEDVLHAWMTRRLDEVRAELRTATGPDAVTRLRTGLHAVAALYEADAETSRSMVRAWVRRGGPLMLGSDDPVVFRGALEDGQRDGDVRPDVEALVAAHVLLDVYLGRLLRWAADGGDLDRSLQAAAGFVLDRLRRPDGPSGSPRG